jgi:predicted transcriptional regulator
MDDVLSIYEKVDEKLKFIATSGIRIKMMTSLLNGSQTSTQLKDSFKVGASTIIHAARDLEKEYILIEKPDGYHLTSIGKILALKTIDMIKTLKTIDAETEFWINHNISDIPTEFILRIDALLESQIVKETPTSLMRGLSLYFKLLRKAKEMRGISSIFHQRFPDIMEKVVERKVDMEFVVTPNVFNTLCQKKYKQRLLNIIGKENFTLYLFSREVKLAFTVTDFMLSFALYLEDGLFDNATNLISYEKEAINWGRELFEYYKSKAKPVKKEDI